MTQQEREQLFLEFYEKQGQKSLFNITKPSVKDTPEPFGSSETLETSEPLAPLTDEERLAKFTEQISSREQDPQFKTLPPIMRKIMAVADSDNVADVLYLSSLAVLSACLPGVKGSWFSEMQLCNLYFFLTGPAASGKGRMKLCSYLVEPLNEYVYEESKWQFDQFINDIIGELSEAQKARITISSNIPGAPSVHRFTIPANSSAPSMYEDIAKNDGMGLIFETEADTLALALRRGDFSDLLRKAFHGEAISLRRKTHREDLFVPHPYLSICLSGTPEQTKTLLKSAENGLFSRFLFYRLTTVDDEDTEAQLHTDARAIELYFTKLGEQVRDFYLRLLSHKQGIEVQFTKSQINQLNDLTTNFSLQYSDLFAKAYGTEKAVDAARSIARRMGLIAFRMAMIRTALRLIDRQHLPSAVACNDDDFYDALYDARVLIPHTHIVYDEMVNPASGDIEECQFELNPDSPDLLTDTQHLLLKSLPEEFTTQELMLISNQIKVTGGTLWRAKNTLCELGLIKSVHRGKYKKTERGIALSKR